MVSINNLVLAFLRWRDSDPQGTADFILTLAGIAAGRAVDTGDERAWSKRATSTRIVQ